MRVPVASAVKAVNDALFVTGARRRECIDGPTFVGAAEPTGTVDNARLLIDRGRRKGIVRIRVVCEGVDDTSVVTGARRSQFVDRATAAIAGPGTAVRSRDEERAFLVNRDSDGE